MQSVSKLFDSLLVFLMESFEKVNFEKSQQTTKNHIKVPSMLGMLRMDKPLFKLHILLNCLIGEYLYMSRSVTTGCSWLFAMRNYLVQARPTDPTM